MSKCGGIVYNPSPWEEGLGRSGIYGLLQLHEFEVSLGYLRSQIEKQNSLKEMIPC